MRYWKSRPLILLLALTALIFALNLYRTVMHQNGISVDFDDYVRLIEPMKLHWTITTPHFIYPVLVTILSKLFPGHGDGAIGAAICLSFQLLLAYVLWRFWNEIFPDSTSAFVVIAITLVSMMVAPVTLLMFRDHHSYFGYIAITVYHNPPMYLCRPIALLNFLIFSQVLGTRRANSRQTTFSAITITLATLMKPNYALIAVPAALVFAAFSMYEKISKYCDSFPLAFCSLLS